MLFKIQAIAEQKIRLLEQKEQTEEQEEKIPKKDCLDFFKKGKIILNNN